MKYCSNCGNELRDEAVLCTKCGNSFASSVLLSKQYDKRKFCIYCGAEVLNNAVVCPKCGCPLKTHQVINSNTNNGLQIAAKVFMIISCVLLGVCFFWNLLAILFFATTTLEIVYCFQISLAYLIPLAWVIPMTIYYFNATAGGKRVRVGFKVCTLLFVSIVAGILMLCDNSNN